MMLFSMPITDADILQHSNHSWESMLHCDEEAYDMEFCANPGH